MIRLKQISQTNIKKLIRPKDSDCQKEQQQQQLQQQQQQEQQQQQQQQQQLQQTKENCKSESWRAK